MRGQTRVGGIDQRQQCLAIAVEMKQRAENLPAHARAAAMLAERICRYCGPCCDGG